MVPTLQGLGIQDHDPSAFQKEEVHPIPMLEERDIPARGCPIGFLVHEHERSRTLMGQLVEDIVRGVETHCARGMEGYVI